MKHAMADPWIRSPRWIPPGSRLQFFATDEQGSRQEIADLYWFEEAGVHDWSGEGHGVTYQLEVFLDGVLVFSNTPDDLPSASGASHG